MTTVRASFNTSSCTDAEFAPSFNYALINRADTAVAVSAFVLLAFGLKIGGIWMGAPIVAPK